MKKNLLIISIYYPPIQSIASNRIESFAKYLDKNKYNIYVHTLGDIDSIDTVNNITINRVKNNVLFKPLLFNQRTNKVFHVIKVLYNIFIKFFCSNEYRGWIKKSLDILPSYLKDKKIDIILSTYAPTAPHIVALELKKGFPNIKWIADMRDEMSLNPFLLKTERKSIRILERSILNNCDALISVSSPIVSNFVKLAQKKSLKVYEIKNGYDFKLNEYKPNNKLFTISHVGSFYGLITPESFLNAMSGLVQKNLIQDFSINFIGVMKPISFPSNLRNKVNIIGKISHQEALKYMRESDALLLIHATRNGKSVYKGAYGGKVFEYLGMQRPILALIDENDIVSDLIRSTQLGYISNNEDIKGIEDILLEVYNNWKNSTILKYEKNLILKLHRKKQTKLLEKIIDNMNSRIINDK